MLPREMYAKLSKYVVGQDHAKKTLATTLTTHDLETDKNIEHNAPRILMVGQTGCGKTYLLQTIQNILAFKVIFINASEYSGATWHGKGIQEIITALSKKLSEWLAQSLNKLPQTYIDSIIDVDDVDSYLTKYAKTLSSKIILVFDEFDKVSFARMGSHGEHKSAFQDDLLKLIENYEFEVIFHYKKFEHLKQAFSLKLNTNVVPMVFMGAFEGFEDLETEKRKPAIGFNSKDSVVEKKSFKEALAKYGFARELCGRINVNTRLHKLSVDDLIAILDKNILTEYVNMFRVFDVAISFSTEFKRQIAEMAINSKEGARALKDLVHEQIYDYLFEIDSYKYERLMFVSVGETKANMDRIDKKLTV